MMSNYPSGLDSFTTKLNKPATGNATVSDEAVVIPASLPSSAILLIHDNYVASSMQVWTGLGLTGTQKTNFTIAANAVKPWQWEITFTDDGSGGSLINAYMTYETTGDEADADDINDLQSAVTATQTELGINPKGTSASVAARSTAIEDSVTSLDSRVTNLEDQASVQVTKLGIIGSVETPYTTDITIPFTSDFNNPPIEVLKFVAGTTNVIRTEMSFDNGDATSFVPDDQVIFDGEMHLKTSYVNDMVDDGNLTKSKLWEYTIDLTTYKTIEKIEVI